MLVRGLRIRKILATNAQPTIEVELKIKAGEVRAAAPMGTSRGSHEAVALPADDAIRKFALILRHFKTEQFYEQSEVDALLHAIDKSSDFREIGGNLALAISSAFLKAFALEKELEPFEYVYAVAARNAKEDADRAMRSLPEHKQRPRVTMPLPLCNVVGGWKGKSGAGQSDVQEFMLMPVSQSSFAGSVANIAHAYNEVGDALADSDAGFTYGRNLEAAWTTKLGIGQILKLLTPIAGNRMLRLGLDLAASNLWNGRQYAYTQGVFHITDSGDIQMEEKLIRTEQLDFVEELTRRFPVAYVEDPFEQEDFVSFGALTHRLGSRGVLVAGDDLYATNAGRLQQGADIKATNAAIVKPNQCGTISDTMAFVALARKAGMRTVMSHRSGETEDTLAAHLAVGLGCDYVKFGLGGERAAKLNELVRIEEKLL
jgi:enolase